MKSVVGFLILMSFQVVLAESDFVDLPSRCFEKNVYPCTIRATHGFLAFEKEEQKFHLAEKSSLLLNSKSEVQLLQGDLWVQESKDLSVKSTSALVMKISGEWFFQKLPDASLLVRNLKGEIAFQSRFVFANEALPVGFQNWFGGLDSSGQITRGVIRPIVHTDFLKVWIPVSGFSMAEIRKSFYVYKELWGEGLSQAAALYQEIAERRLASQEQKLRKHQQQHQALKSEQEKIRQLYREKNGLGEGADH